MDTQNLEMLRADVARKKQLARSLEALRRRRSELARRLEEHESVSRAEDADVAKLEGFGFTNLIDRLTGKLEHKLDLERIEAEAARRAMETARQNLAAADSEILRKEAELEGLRDCDACYEAALAARLKAVTAADPQASARIRELEEQITAAKLMLAEIQEARTAADQAMKSLRQLQAELDEAENYATWDLLGGGRIADFAKYSHLDKAQGHQYMLETKLRKLSRELQDVAISVKVNVQMDSWLRFADYVSDSIWTDWAAMEHINQAQGQTNILAGRLSGLKNKLKTMYADTEAQIVDLRRQIEDAAIQSPV